MDSSWNCQINLEKCLFSKHGLSNKKSDTNTPQADILMYYKHIFFRNRIYERSCVRYKSLIIFIGLAPNRRAGQILILGFYLDNFRDKNRRKIVKTGARNEKTAQKSKSKSRAGFILILGSKWRRFGGRPILTVILSHTFTK